MTRATVKNSQIQHPQTNNVSLMQNLSAWSFKFYDLSVNSSLFFASSEFLESVVKFSVEIMRYNLRSVRANTDIPHIHTHLTRYFSSDVSAVLWFVALGLAIKYRALLQWLANSSNIRGEISCRFSEKKKGDTRVKPFVSRLGKKILG